MPALAINTALPRDDAAVYAIPNLDTAKNDSKCLGSSLCGVAVDKTACAILANRANLAARCAGRADLFELASEVLQA